MAEQTLAIKYRPKSFDDVTEQDSIKTILSTQLDCKSTKNAYLFVGGAGTGKTTTARIFADAINNGAGVPIELDAASNSSVDDVREIIKQAKTASLDSEYKVFIIDECHSLSNTAWQAFLKLLEEPPAKSVFIFCTTNPEKIPKTILSRVQRYDFRRISQKGIVDRLLYICDREVRGEDGLVRLEALEYLAKLADGGMRDAITLLDKCLSFSHEVTIANIVEALGVADYSVMMNLTDAILDEDGDGVIRTVESTHESGVDLKQFIRQYINFILDIKKWFIMGNLRFTQLPEIDNICEWLTTVDSGDGAWDKISHLLETLIKINTDIKYDSSPKCLIEAMLLSEV